MILFTINVTNTGPVNLDPVIVDDKLPHGLEWISDNQTTRSFDGNNITWDIGGQRAECDVKL